MAMDYTMQPPKCFNTVNGKRVHATLSYENRLAAARKFQYRKR